MYVKLPLQFAAIGILLGPTAKILGVSSTPSREKVRQSFLCFLQSPLPLFELPLVFFCLPFGFISLPYKVTDVI